MNHRNISSKEILKYFGRSGVPSAIKHFSVRDFNINLDEFVSGLKSTFISLPFDYYDVGFKIEQIIQNKEPETLKDNYDDWIKLWNRIGRKESDKMLILSFWKNRCKDLELYNSLEKIQPHRKRSCFKYKSVKSQNQFKWDITEVGVPIYRQNVQDKRARNRIWSMPSIEVIRNKNILKLIAIFSELLTHNPAVGANKFFFTFHQMLTYAKGDGNNNPAPEGTHQDGTDFIISAIVVERNNVTGGESSIFYGKEKFLAMKSILQPGEGIFQADEFNNLWHGISPLHKIDTSKMAYRSIIGFDIEFIN